MMTEPIDEQSGSSATGGARAATSRLEQTRERPGVAVVAAGLVALALVISVLLALTGIGMGLYAEMFAGGPYQRIPP
jgi:hypothetical protein